MKGVILAGGSGSRLAPLTRITNKHLLPLYDRPMVTYAVRALVEAGFTELMLVTGAPANGGSCVAHHEGRVVFVRYALPGERVRVRVTVDRGSYWHAEAVEVIEPSADRIASLCPIAGVDGAGCCDLAFAAPEAARALKAHVVANQLERLGIIAPFLSETKAEIGWTTLFLLGVLNSLHIAEAIL